MSAFPKRAVDLIGVASSLGGADAACAQGPARLAAAGIDERLRGAGLQAAWSTTLQPRRSGTVRAKVAHLCGELAPEVGRSLGAGRPPA